MLRYNLPFLFMAAYVITCFSVIPANAELRPIDSRIRFSYETVEMPAPDARMGLLGFHLLVDLHPNWYAGIGGYGSVKGDRGGFLTGGLTGGVQKKLISDLWFDAGLFVGAGGGGSAPQGDGLMLRPYAGLRYDFSSVNLGLSYSRIVFPDTDIASDNIAFFLDIPFMSYISNGKNDLASSALDHLDIESDQVLGFARQEYLFKLSAYYPTDSVYNTGGIKSEERMDLIGVQFRHFLSSNAYALAGVMGAFGGNADGYAEIMFGGGYRLPLTPGKKLRLNLEVSLGAGGGGQVDVSGGALAKGEAGLEFRFSPDVFLALNGGYIDSITGSFEAKIISGEIGFTLDNLGSGFGTKPILESDTLRWNYWRIRTSLLTYSSPERKGTSDDDKALQLIGLKIDHFLDDYFYISGQASASYSGTAGGYAAGLIGLGLQSDPLRDTNFRIFAELLAGAAGGGGIDVGAGSIWQSMAGLEYNFNETFSIQTMAGMVKAIDGNLSSPVYDLSLSWRFTTLGRKIE